MLSILSLGAGVQSTTVLLMSCVGELPKLDCAIFADTGWEPAAVYEHLTWLTEYSEKCGIPVHKVGHRNIRNEAVTQQARGHRLPGEECHASMPLFVLSPEGDKGMVNRQCTGDYKIEPIERFIKRELLGVKPRGRAPVGAVEHWFGISMDEWQRMRTSKDKWKTNRYPLIDMKVTRAGCLSWLEQNGFTKPPRSCCIGCPFHSDAEWRDMKENRPAEFEDACQVDDAIRKSGGMRGDMFLHAKRIPLRLVDLRTDYDKGQGDLFGCESGYCWT